MGKVKTKKASKKQVAINKKLIAAEEEKTFEKELTTILNQHCVEDASDTPDYVLARYLKECLNAFNNAIISRDHFHGGR
jgi:hypothetical protein